MNSQKSVMLTGLKQTNIHVGAKLDFW